MISETRPTTFSASRTVGVLLLTVGVFAACGGGSKTESKRTTSAKKAASMVAQYRPPLYEQMNQRRDNKCPDEVLGCMAAQENLDNLNT
ncbi:MAG: hypothetical protein ABR548_03340, partial [Actinomycetota bacterium]